MLIYFNKFCIYDNNKVNFDHNHEICVLRSIYFTKATSGGGPEGGLGANFCFLSFLESSVELGSCFLSSKAGLLNCLLIKFCIAAGNLEISTEEAICSMLVIPGGRAGVFISDSISLEKAINTIILKKN